MAGKSQSGYQQNVVWVNRGNGKFDDVSKVVYEPITKDSRSVVVADLWNRGVLDVVVANQNAEPFIYRNEVTIDHHWIGFELTGSVSNRSAVGSRIDLYWNGQMQTQFVTAGIGFSGQNQERIHFGIGPAKDIEKVEITWPSGKKQVIDNPGVDKLHKVEEGK
jgi:hypothetical protein